MNKKVFIALPLALMLTVGLTACGSNNESGNGGGGENKEPEIQIQYRDKDYVDVTAIGGTIKDKDYSHDKIEKNKNVTIVAPATKGTEKFDGWYDGNEKVSDQAEYTFAPSASVVYTARYDGTTVSKWDGEYPSDKEIVVSNQATTAADGGYVADFTNKVWHITSAAGLAYWAELVNCYKTGNPECGYVFSAFDRGIYGITEGDNQKKLNAAYNPSNAWTLSLECDIDLDYQAWKPIIEWNNCMYGLTFEGNGHTISNLYAVNYKQEEAPAFTGYVGFFGAVHADDFTMRNVTFDGAYLTSPAGSVGNQWGGVAIGVLSSGDYNAMFGQPNTTIMENVNVTNAFIGGQGTTKSGFLIGVTGQYAAFPGSTAVNQNDNSLIILRNCHVTGGTMVTKCRSGALVGYMNHAVDSDPGIGVGEEEIKNVNGALEGAISKPIPQISIVYTGCSVSNVKVLAWATEATKDTMFGSLGTAECWGLTTNGKTYHNIANEKNVTRISLMNNDGTNLVFNDEELASAVTDKAIVIVCRDAAITQEQLDEMELKEGLVIYVLEGVTLSLPEGHNITVYTLKTSEVDDDGHAAVYEDTTKKGIFNAGLVAPTEGGEEGGEE